MYMHAVLISSLETAHPASRTSSRDWLGNANLLLEMRGAMGNADIGPQRQKYST